MAERVEKILRLAEAEAEDLRAAARTDAAAIIEAAERDAARIRAEAELARHAADRPSADGGTGVAGPTGPAEG